MVWQLASRLATDNNPYARQQLVRVQNFSYILYEGYEIRQSRRGFNFKGIILTGLGAAAFLLFPPSAPAVAASSAVLIPVAGTITGIAGLILIGSQGVVMDKGTISRLEFNEVRVYPYSGRREIVRKGIPGMQLAQELNIQLQ